MKTNIKIKKYLDGYVICKPDKTALFKELYWDPDCKKWEDDIFDESILTKERATKLMEKLS